MITLNEIRAKCHAEKLARFDGSGFMERSYVLHRRLASLLTWLFLNAFPAVTPNQISWLMMCVGLGGVLLLARPAPGLAVLGVLLLYVSFLLDKVDGDIARFRKKFSRSGDVLDELYHLILQPLTYLGLGVHGYTATGHYYMFAIGLVSQAAAGVERLIPKITDVAFGKDAEGDAAVASRQASGVQSWLRSLTYFVTRFDIRMVVFLATLILEQRAGSAGRFYILAVLLAYASVYVVRMIVIGRSLQAGRS